MQCPEGPRVAHRAAQSLHLRNRSAIFVQREHGQSDSGLWRLHLQRALGKKHGELGIQLKKHHETYQCAAGSSGFFGVCGPSDKGGLLMFSHDVRPLRVGIAT